MILATVNTGRFDWQVAASDKDSADAYLLDAYQAHVEQYPDLVADPNIMAQMIGDGEVDYTELIVGQVLRDGSPMQYRPSTQCAHGMHANAFHCTGRANEMMENVR